MAAAAQPVLSQMTLDSLDVRKPSIQVTGDSKTIQAILKNDPFPSDLADITVGQLNAQASAGGQFNLPGIADAPVSFDASASANASLAAYQNTLKLASDLGFTGSSDLPLNVAFPINDTDRLVVVRWGFDLAGKLNGSIALNPTSSVTFGASGGADGLFAFATAVNKSVHAGDAFRQMLKTWTTPGTIASGVDKLPAFTWIVSEVAGEVSANLGVTAGYDFNWVRSLSLNDLEGEIGLRITAGLQASLSANLASKYYFVLSREKATDDVRLRLFRAKTKGWDFALHAAVSVTPSTGSFLPENLDDFIQGILGIHDTHLIDFLHASTTADIVNTLGREFLQKAGVEQDVDKAFANLQAFLTKWEALPHAVTSLVWKYAGTIEQFNKIKDIVGKLASPSLSDSSIRNILDSFLKNASFHDNPAVQWLEAIASKSLFELYESDDFTPVRKAASDLAGILDGSKLESVLANLKAQVDAKLDIPSLQTAAQNGDISGLSVWVAQRLAKFLNIDLTNLKDNIGKIDAAIKTIKAKSQEIYAATLRALNNTYGFSLDYAYSSSSTQSALIDVQFADGARAPMADAIKGNFQQILAGPIPGVTLNTCTLAHSIRRSTHIEVHAPWFNGASDDLATGYAKQTFADSDGGRLQLFEAGASDTFTKQRNTNVKRFANCSIGISAEAKGVRKYNVSAVDFGYSFVTSNSKMTRSAFEYEFGAAANQYFPGKFGNSNNDPAHATFESWVIEWDKFTDANPTAVDGDGVIGNTWANLQIRCPAKSGIDWVSALINGTRQPDYMAMSRAMQEKIRKYMLLAYASDPNRFANIPADGRDPISGFLVYTALPPLNDFRIDGSELKPNPKGDLVWDVLDSNLSVPITNSLAPGPLQDNLNRIAGLLTGIPNLKSSAGFYKGQAGKIVGNVVQFIPHQNPYINLLQGEKGVIDAAHDAFEKLRKAGNSQLQNSLQKFSSALINLVSVFNVQIAKLNFGAEPVFRLFAPIVFQSAVQAMFAGTAALPFDATLDVAVLKGADAADVSQPPPDDQILLRQHITSFA